MTDTQPDPTGELPKISAKGAQVLTWTNIRVKLGELKPWRGNPRQSTKAQAKKILKSFDEFGQVETVAVGPGFEVYDGHQRLSALLVVHGPDCEIDARQSSRALTEDERKRLVLALHAGAVGSWDWDIVSSWDAPLLMENGLDADTLKDWKRDTAALDNFLKSEQVAPVDAEPQTDRAEELQEIWKVKRGDLWQIGEHRLLCGDSTSVEDVARITAGVPFAVATDPPYGISYSLGGGGGGITKKDGSRYPKKFTGDDLVIGDDNPFDPSFILEMDVPTILWGGNHYASRLPDSPSWLVWDKRRGTSVNDFADAEIAWTNLGGVVRVFSHMWNGMLKDSEAGEERLHPTQKAVMVISWSLGFVDPSLYVADFFAGSGTTLVACQNLSRKCRAIEISENYCAVILDRMATAFPHLEIKRLD